MQTLNNYGFALECDKDYPLEHYDDISGTLCNICVMAEYAAKGKLHDTIVFSFIVNRSPNIYGTICIINGKAHLGVYYDGKIYRHCKIEVFNTFYSKAATDILSKRCYNQIRLVIDGKVSPNIIASPEIVSAWEDVGMLQQQNENKKNMDFLNR